MLGHALGCLGLSLDDFCRLTPAEFAAVAKAHAAERESLRRESWERMRLLAAIVVQPHVRKRLTPQQLLPLPWDKPEKREPPVSKETAGKRLGKLMERRKR